MYNNDGYAMASAIVRLGQWTRDADKNTDLILSVIDLLKRFDKLDDGTVNNKSLFMNFIADCASNVCGKFSSMDVINLARFNPYVYPKESEVFITTGMILSRIKLLDCFNASGDEVPIIVDKVIDNLPTFSLKDGVKNDAIDKLRKIKSYISTNGLPGEDEMFQSCLIFSVKHEL